MSTQPRRPAARREITDEMIDRMVNQVFDELLARNARSLGTPGTRATVAVLARQMAAAAARHRP